MSEEQIKQKIKELKETLSGNIFEDMETQQEIYELKKQLNPEIVDNPELDDDEGCISCSG